MNKIICLLAAALVSVGLHAEIAVSDVKVFSGYPWKEVVVGYTITGTDADASLFVTATDQSTKKSYMAKSVEGIDLSEGRHVLRWSPSADGVMFSSENIVISLELVPCVQLWEGGPYWARCNVGAEKPEDYGYYFWWGDTVGYKRNVNDDGWVSVANGAAFSFGSGNCPTYGKSNTTLKSQGYIDASGDLVTEYDAAAKHLGAPWRMPTAWEMRVLISKCTTSWTTRNGVYGRLVTGKGAYASKSIFLPGDGSSGSYWSSTPNSDYSAHAWYLHFDSSDFYRDYGDRYSGRTVRPVRGFAK